MNMDRLKKERKIGNKGKEEYVHMKAFIRQLK